MVPTIVPDNVNYMANAMAEKARIRDKMPSAILNVAFGSGPNGAGAQEVLNNAKHDIFAAARQGRIDPIRALIKSGRASATDRDDGGITPLHLAVITGRVPACAYLIEQGAEVNAFGGSVPATPLQWAARKGLVDIIDLLIQHGANPRLIDPQDFSCVHSVTHSSNHWALLYILCQPGIVVDESDNMGLTPLHWAAQQGDKLSVEVLLKFGANPNVEDRNGLTALHWAASGGNWSCISQLLEAGADVRAMSRDNQKAEEMADRYNNREAWNAAVGELGFKADGTRVRRPLSEPGVKIITFLSPTVFFCTAFTIASIFPWYMCVVLSPAAYITMAYVVQYELLLRNTISETIYNSLYPSGTIVGSSLSMAYAWFTRLQYNALDNRVMHFAFLFLLVVFMFMFLCTMFCDPGICATKKKDLKLVIGGLVRENHLNPEAFCIKCMTVKPTHARHCFLCKKCITYSNTLINHSPVTLNCIGVKNYTYFVVYVWGFNASIIVFNYLVWTYFTTLENIPLPLAVRSCVLLPYAICKILSTDTYLISVAIWTMMEALSSWAAIIKIVRIKLS